MNRQVKEAGRPLEAALAAVREYESPMLGAEDRKALAEIAQRVEERLATLSEEEQKNNAFMRTQTVG
jgi:hypothetical protein